MIEAFLYTFFLVVVCVAHVIFMVNCKVADLCQSSAPKSAPALEIEGRGEEGLLDFGIEMF